MRQQGPGPGDCGRLQHHLPQGCVGTKLSCPPPPTLVLHRQVFPSCVLLPTFPISALISSHNSASPVQVSSQLHQPFSLGPGPYFQPMIWTSSPAELCVHCFSCPKFCTSPIFTVFPNGQTCHTGQGGGKHGP